MVSLIHLELTQWLSPCLAITFLLFSSSFGRKTDFTAFASILIWYLLHLFVFLNWDTTKLRMEWKTKIRASHFSNAAQTFSQELSYTTKNQNRVANEKYQWTSKKIPSIKQKKNRIIDNCGTNNGEVGLHSVAVAACTITPSIVRQHIYTTFELDTFLFFSLLLLSYWKI